MKSHTLSAYVGIGITLAFATIALVLRLVSRRLTKYGYGYEDGLAILAYARNPSFRCYDIALISITF